MKRPHSLVAVAACLVMAAGLTLPAQTVSRLTFIGVSLDNDTELADRRLAQFLFDKTGIRLTTEEVEYGQAIRRVVDWRREEDPFVARMTPYAYVVAELLGARIEPLATYVNAQTARTTYRAHFVVNRAAFNTPPELSDLLRFLGAHKSRPRFVYHSEFSTSSFFLPSLFFRSNHVFQMAEATEKLAAIASDKTGDPSSSALVERVASGAADFAAVWDGVKARYERDPKYAASGAKVYFIPLPTILPNDLLVCSADLDPATKSALRKAIGGMEARAIRVGDFDTWQSLNSSEEARLALGNLRQTARDAVTRVPVDIQLDKDAPASAVSLLEPARQAVRLSETEFTVFDADFHDRPDMRWTLQPVHDGAVVLHSTIPGYNVDEQSFQISFRDGLDLTARIVSIVQSRLHRIRYIWPYFGGAPIVIRDSAFSLPVGAPVKAQRITWVDPERNQFRAGEVFESRVTSASFYRYELNQPDFERPVAGGRLDPMSNAAFRVVMMRPAERPWLFRLLTMALVGCFLLAGASAGWSMWRGTGIRPPSGSQPPAVPSSGAR